jgi:hypothetical protein
MVFMYPTRARAESTVAASNFTTIKSSWWRVRACAANGTSPGADSARPDLLRERSLSPPSRAQVGRGAAVVAQLALSQEKAHTAARRTCLMISGSSFLVGRSVRRVVPCGMKTGCVATTSLLAADAGRGSGRASAGVDLEACATNSLGPRTEHDIVAAPRSSLAFRTTTWVGRGDWRFGAF